VLLLGVSVKLALG